MEFTTTAGSFREALTRARTAISARPSLMAHRGALVEAVKGSPKPVRITGSSDNLTVIAAALGSKTTVNGTALLDPAPLQGLLSSLNSAEQLQVEATDTHLIVSRENSPPYRFVLMTADYPDPPAVSGTRTQVNFRGLGDAVAAVRRSVGEESLVQLKSTAETLSLASTDNYRLTLATLRQGGFGDFTAILQLPAVERIAKAEPSAIDYDRRSVRVATEEAIVTVRTLTQAAFPEDLSVVLQQTPRYQLTVPRGDFASALQRLHAVDATVAVTLSIDQDTIDIALSNSAAGHGAETLKIHAGPSELVVASVNLKFLLDSVLAHPGDEIQFGFTGPTDLILTESTSEDLKVVSAVMPLAPSSG